MVDIPRQRVYLILVAFVVFIGSIGTHLATFQVLRGTALEQEARDGRLGERAVPARRGTITNSSGFVLASTIPMDRLEIDRSQMVDARGATAGDLVGSTTSIARGVGAPLI